MVQIRVSARHTSVSERDRQLITEKLERLSKFLPGMDTAEVHFSEERNPRIPDKEICEVTLEGHGHHVRCRANGPDHLTAIDRAIEKLENKLHKLKTKLARKPSHRDPSRAKLWKTATTELPVEELLSANGTGEEEPPEELDLDYRIVKTKKVEKLSLMPYEAAWRMDLLSHSFYFFTNLETGRPAIVYRRDDGDIGLIDEIG